MGEMIRRVLRAMAEPKVIVPIVLSLALLGFLLGIADAPKVGSSLAHISPLVVALNFPLVLAYLGFKVFQFDAFLKGVRIPVPWRQLMLSFATGEMSTSVPGGVYLQNYVLRRIAAAGFARSSAATTAVLATEGGVSLIIVAILGVPGWGWLRPLILAFLFLAAVGVVVLIKVAGVRNTIAGALQSGRIAPVGRGLVVLTGALYELFTPSTVVRAALVCASYLLVQSAGFLLISHAVGETDFTYSQAVTVYAFSLAVVLLSPISTQLGVVEAGALGPLQAMGYDITQALAMLLGFRLVWTVSVWFVGGLVLLLLRGEWH